MSEETFICKICDRQLKSRLSLSRHVGCVHKIKDVKNDYYKLYDMSVFANCVLCNSKIFRIYKTEKYATMTCSKECLRALQSSKKQSPETIQKRLQNTDQKKKEEARRKTMLEKYGSPHYCSDNEQKSRKLSAALKGKKHTKEHHEKVIESKRKKWNYKSLRRN